MDVIHALTVQFPALFLFLRPKITILKVTYTTTSFFGGSYTKKMGLLFIYFTVKKCILITKWQLSDIVFVHDKKYI